MKEVLGELYGNEAVKKRISAAAFEGRLPHAFLIDGPEGSGKYTLATLIASLLNCERRDDPGSPTPCGVCNNCRRIREGIFSDVRILGRQGDRATIGVDDVKELRKDMFLSATESGYKIYIIRDAHRLTTEAQNALLIVLEEPPKNVIIFLLASGTDRILTTIKSRTQYIAMSRFSADEIERYLISHHSVSPERARLAALGADGRIGRALSLTSPASAQEEKERRELIDRFASAISPRAQFADIYSLLAEAPSKRAEFTEFLEGALDAVRDLILTKKCDNFTTAYFPTVADAASAAEGISLGRLLSVYDIISATHLECSKNANVSAMQLGMAAKIKLGK
ncbi:MAG: hypothetical protein IJX38_02340 [Clostridia bacterium]|nr:hypothetical protein [Clostridia bacterium]MBQ8371768.1 hypothetical protein [Clostridia bacterium]